MDTSDLILEYSEGDFADAYRGLLPKGEYWQDTENAELANTINGIAKDFKQTHDDIELSLLTRFEEQGFGWKIRDYQSLLGTMGSEGLVYDDVNRPNLILIDLPNLDNRAAINAFENVRLPHTEFHWLYQLEAEAQFEPVAVSAMKPLLSTQLEIEAETQILCRTALTWQLEIGDTE
ncbi:Phage tail protein [Vibrio neptunius]|uniref:hypothetical protein n=1 Tax=Vibrio neptunius TaxID=170651 RepID=UPI001C5CA459|nr:hypothetical protein [Vibrio neptunius]QXX09244.1 hypothetical protein KW548_19520 [Vibrio neptunius]